MADLPVDARYDKGDPDHPDSHPYRTAARCVPWVNTMLYPPPKLPRTAEDCNKLLDAWDPAKTALPAEHHERLRKFARSLYYRRLVAVHPCDLGRCGLYRVRYDMAEGSGIVRVPARRIAPEKLVAAYKQCDEWSKMNNIKLSKSPFSAPPVIVPKPHSTDMRTCMDYRMLNMHMVSDSFPLPRCDELLASIKDATYFSTIDLQSGFMQMENDPETAHVTAFTLPGRHYEFNVLPFGVKNGPCVFQRLMSIVLFDLLGAAALNFIDDILIYGRDVDEMFLRLNIVFDRLEQANLMAGYKKVNLFRTQVVFLGFLIDQHGVRPDPEKVAAFQNCQPPRTYYEVRRLLGFMQFHASLIPRLAIRMSPITKLLVGTKSADGRKPTANNHGHLPHNELGTAWGEEQQAAFEDLKTAISTAALTAYPTPDGLFVLSTDASGDGLGAVLQQYQSAAGQPDVIKLQSIAFASRPLAKAERHYGATKLELLGVVYAVRKFQQYLLGRRFILLTDHQALQWLFTNMPKLEGIFARWVVFLSGFDIAFIYRRGEDNGAADFLSRLTTQTDVDAAVTNAPFRMRTSTLQQLAIDKAVQFDGLDEIMNSATLFAITAGQTLPQLPTADEWPALQTTDAELAIIMASIPTGRLPINSPLGTERLWRYREQLIVENGLLHYRKEARLLLVVPTAQRELLIALVHGGAASAHLGPTITIHEIKKSYWWPNMKADVQRTLSTCATCQKTKNSTTNMRAPLVPILAARPFERVQIDLIGPMANSCGYTYILTMVDAFSRWIEAVPLTNKRADTVAWAVLTTWICRHGWMAILHSDNGTEFINATMAHLCDWLGVRRTNTTPYHPQGNGLCERANQAIKRAITAIVVDHGSKWHHALPLALWCLRSAIHSSTGHSPFELLHGTAMGRPYDFNTETSDGTKLYSEYVDQLVIKAHEAFKSAQDHMAAAQAKYKAGYDQRASPRTFFAGDLVLARAFRTPCDEAPGEKFYAKWIGPYKVLYAYPNGVSYRLGEMNASGQTWVDHVNNLKKYRQTETTTTHEIAGIFSPKARRNLSGHPLWAQPTWTRPPDTRPWAAPILYLAARTCTETSQNASNVSSNDAHSIPRTKLTRKRNFHHKPGSMAKTVKATCNQVAGPYIDRQLDHPAQPCTPDAPNLSLLPPAHVFYPAAIKGVPKPKQNQFRGNKLETYNYRKSVPSRKTMRRVSLQIKGDESSDEDEDTATERAKTVSTAEQGEGSKPKEDDTSARKETDTGKQAAAKAKLTEEAQVAGQTSKLSQPPSRMSSADSQRTQPFTTSMLGAPKQLQQTEIAQAISKIPPVASLSETSITSTAISDAAKMAASIKAAGVNLSDLDVDEGLTRSTADEDATAGHEETDAAEEDIQARPSDTTKPKPQSTVAESETENIADVTLSVEVFSDEDEWPAYVEDPNLTDEQNGTHKEAFIESIKRRDAAATEVLEDTKASKDELVHTLARRIANDLRGRPSDATDTEVPDSHFSPHNASCLPPIYTPPGQPRRWATYMWQAGPPDYPKLQTEPTDVTYSYDFLAMEWAARLTLYLPHTKRLRLSNEFFAQQCRVDDLPGRAGLLLQNVVTTHKPRLTRMECCSFGHLLEQWAKRTKFDDDGRVASCLAAVATGPATLGEAITRRDMWGSWAADAFNEYWRYTRDAAESVLPDNFTFPFFIEWLIGPTNAKYMKDVDRIIQELTVGNVVWCRLMPPFATQKCWEAGDRYPRTYVPFDTVNHHILWPNACGAIQPIHDPAAIVVAIAAINRFTAHRAGRRCRSKTTIQTQHIWDWQSAAILQDILKIEPLPTREDCIAISFKDDELASLIAPPATAKDVQAASTSQTHSTPTATKSKTASATQPGPFGHKSAKFTRVTTEDSDESDDGAQSTPSHEIKKRIDTSTTGYAAREAASATNVGEGSFFGGTGFHVQPPRSPPAKRAKHTSDRSPSQDLSFWHKRKGTADEEWLPPSQRGRPTSGDRECTPTDTRTKPKSPATPHTSQTSSHTHNLAK